MQEVFRDGEIPLLSDLTPDKSGIETGKAAPLCDFSISTLAWVGDAVYELAVRLLTVKGSGTGSGKLHRAAIPYVSAAGQAKGIEDIADRLEQEEREFLKRARNFHSVSRAKNASAGQYRKATAAEALIGWLWLQGKHERAEEIMRMILCSLDDQNDLGLQ